MIGAIAETSPGVFAVEVTPTADGTLQLQVSAGAVLTDVAGNPLDTSSAIGDDTSLAVLTPDTAPPAPNPMTFAVAPSTSGATSIAMTATTASDPSGVEYYFTCTVGGGGASFLALPRLVAVSVGTNAMPCWSSRSSPRTAR